MSGIRIQKDVNARKMRSLIVLGIITCVCLAICLIGYLSGDKTAPKLDFSYAVASVSYSKADPLESSDFLKGVTASDSKDGDLTSDIYVSALQYSEDGKSVTVNYRVKDHNGNITTAKRIYNLNGSVATIFEQVAEVDKTGDTSADDSTKQSVVETTERQTKEETTKAKETTEEATTEEITEGPTEEITEAPQVDEGSSEELPSEELPSESEQQVPVEVDEPSSEVVEAGANPVLILSQNELSIPVGSEPVNFGQFVANLYDDVDDYFKLYSTLWVENESSLDYNVPGEYILIFHVQDSDGNWSEPVNMTVYIG